MGNPTGKGGIRFQKGVSGNPGGKRKKDPTIKAFQETSYKDFINKLQEFGSMSPAQMKEIVQAPDAKMFDVIFGRILYDASQGKADARQILLERLWGKVKSQIELEHAGNIDFKEKVKNMSTEELLKMVNNTLPQKDM